MGNLLDQHDILELTKLAQAEDPSGPDGYGVPFAHLEAIRNDVLPPNPPLDGEIALMGLKWPGFKAKKFNALSASRADFGNQFNAEEEALYQAGLAYLAALGAILPTLRTLTETNAAISPWNQIHTVIKSVDNIGLPETLVPAQLVQQIRQEFPK